MSEGAILGINRTDTSLPTNVSLMENVRRLISSEDVGEFYRDKVSFADATLLLTHRLIEQFCIAGTK